VLARQCCSGTHGITLYATVGRADMTHAADVEDAGRANVCTDISRGIEKRLGALDAHLHR
jgi:hypothetical protein